MRKRRTGIVGILAGLVVLVGVMIAAMEREAALTMIFGPVEHAQISFATLVPSERPNQYLVCPEGFCRARPHLISPVYEEPATSLRDRWMRMIARQPRVTRTHANEGELQYDFVQRSRFVGFPDTITVRFIPLDEGRSTLAVYSRSHYGHGDFGVNRRRIEAWLATLSETPE